MLKKGHPVIPIWTTHFFSSMNVIFSFSYFWEFNLSSDVDYICDGRKKISANDVPLQFPLPTCKHTDTDGGEMHQCVYYGWNSVAWRPLTLRLIKNENEMNALYTESARTCCATFPFFCTTIKLMRLNSNRSLYLTV